MWPNAEKAHQDLACPHSLLAWRQHRGEATEDEDDEGDEAVEEEDTVQAEAPSVVVVDSSTGSHGSAASAVSVASGRSGSPCVRHRGLVGPGLALLTRRRSVSDPGRLAGLAGLTPALGAGAGPGPSADLLLLPGPGPRRADPSLVHSVDKIVDFLKFLN